MSAMCDTCDLATAHERIIGLVDENKQLQAERDYAALEYKREHALRLEIKAEAERLRYVVDAARTVDKHLNSDAIFEEMREVWGNTNTSIWRDVLLRLGSALAALEEEVGE